MININELIKDIERSRFFSRMGLSDIENENIILIDNVEKVFINPSDIEFKGFYEQTEWLPTSPTQDDPFYKIQGGSKELIELRIKINKAVMNATKGLSKDKFISGPQDFSLAARNGICFAFRQYVTEQYLCIGDKWSTIVDIYYDGHWPVGFTKEKLIVI